VEACSSSINDLLYAEQVAFNYIVTNYPTTGGQVSNSWQGSEFTGQLGDDALFADFTYNFATGYKTPILAFASSGDGGYGVGSSQHQSVGSFRRRYVDTAHRFHS
jgi:hypothetical protein